MNKAGAPVNAKAIFTIKSFFALMLQPSLEVALLIGSYSSTIKVHLYCNSKTHTCFNLKNSEFISTFLNTFRFLLFNWNGIQQKHRAAFCSTL